MLASVNPKEPLAVARLQEFLSDRAPWYRSLWGVGVVMAMEELYEACIAMRQGILSDSSVKRISSSLQRRVGQHPAFSDAEKRFVQQSVSQVPRADGPAHYAIRDFANRVRGDYLVRWGRAVAADQFAVEHFARSAGAYLLDLGFAGQYLFDFIQSRLDDAAPITLQQLCEALQAEVVANPQREFEVLLAFTTVPELSGDIPPSWLQGPSVTDWLKRHGFDTASVRSPVAIVLKVQARDAIGAVQSARNEADRFAARALIATGKTLNRIPTLWVKGSASPTPMKEASRGVAVKELFQEDRVFSSESSGSVDAALELLAHLESSSAPAAVAGGWGAIEGLLADPSDKASAADNLATLVTCSFPRAELTALSYRVQRLHPKEAKEFETATSNRDRSRILAQMIIDGRLPPMKSLRDQAAVDRLKKLLANPTIDLHTVREAIGDSFHRLYRQRNFILHGAQLNSVALPASLRTVAKLAGAGMDRITHGHYVQNLRPMELVARANLALALISRESALNCVDLLEVS